MRQRSGPGVMAFVRSLVLLGAVVVGVPWLLLAAARARFDGGAPLHGVPSPSDWSADRIRSALTDRLTDQTIADIVIRLSLLVAWAAVIVLLLTVVAEVAHMLRHDGLPMPDVRGLGLSQSAARVIAAGLLVVVPMISSPSRTIAREGVDLVPRPRSAPATALAPERPEGIADAPGVETPLPGSVAGRQRSAEPRSWSPAVGGAAGNASGSAAAAGEYVVRPGDSVFGIAERMVGPDRSAVADYAERLLELNLGEPMIDGQHFTNAAYIDVGWVLQLPLTPSPEVNDSPAGAEREHHVVERGESLWSIADDELGDARRWPEIYDANRGRTFDDGRALDDPDLIHPGWDLELPTEVDAGPALDHAAQEAEESEEVEEVEEVEETAPAEPPAAPAVPDADVGGVRFEETGSPGAESDATDGDRAEARPQNVWVPKRTTVDLAAGGAGGPDTGPTDPDGATATSPQLLTYGRAAMLSAGVLTLLAVRRRDQLRRARPRARLVDPKPGAASTERTLRAIDAGERFQRVEAAIRAVAPAHVDAGARVLAVSVGADGELELRSTGPIRLAPPWTGAGERWQLAAAAPIELLTEGGAGVGVPCPTLVQLGRDLDGRDVYVDLEAFGAIELGGPGDQADAVVAAIAATLAGSVLAEVTTLVGLGVPDEAFLGHRLHEPVRDVQRAFEVAADALGSTASQSRSTFELRVAGAVSGETWEPTVVLAGSAAGVVPLPAPRTGLVIVSASPIHGPSSRLAPDGDAWELKPAGIRLVPVGLTTEDLAAITDLVDVATPEEPALVAAASYGDDAAAAAATAGVRSGRAGDAVEVASGHGDDEHPDDLTIAPVADRPVPVEPAWSLMVRLLGPVEVVAPGGEAVAFERSKTRELVAWLATHRERSTRTAARTALWELDVRDATFANVVSEARRALARLVEPPEGEEWVGRTMTDDLPLHELVRTDTDLLEHALDAALLQPPGQAIATLTPAVERITGLPFEGTSYLWPDAEGLTSQFVLLATSAATELAAHCLSLGDVDGVFAATGRGLRVLPGHEELIGLRMQAHARAGDHAGVRQEWESYERVINADPWSDGEPSPKLVELRRELLNPSR